MRKLLGAAFAATLAFGGAAQACEFIVLYPGHSGTPIGALADDTGRVYLATYGGGKYQRGTVVRLDGDGAAKMLYEFKDKAGPSYPSSPLLRGPDGVLYGVASRMNGTTYGTAVFKLDHGHETTLHFFGEGNSALGGPMPGLVMDAAGNLYGATVGGGANGIGQVFKIAPDGTTNVLHSFSGPDGRWVQGDLMLDANGTIFGTTFAGGAEESGTIFRITSDGTFAQLHSFVYATEGTQIWSGLVGDAKGNLYGTANYGGPSFGGTVFKLSANGKLSVLHAFTGNSDGERPQGTLVRDAKGNLFGITQHGGDGGDGTVYRLKPNGQMRVLHAFTNGEDGGWPLGGLTMDASGSLYGATLHGGNVFEIRR